MNENEIEKRKKTKWEIENKTKTAQTSKILNFIIFFKFYF